MLRRLIIAITVSLLPLSVMRAQSTPTQDLTPNSDLSLVAESNALRQGGTTTVALRITMEPGWHTYWTNPGDAGLPLVAQWKLPAGVTVSRLQFPTPHLLPQPPLMSYGYEREVLVLADVAVSSTIPVGAALTLAADVDFLVCAEICIPASGHVEWTTRAVSE